MREISRKKRIKQETVSHKKLVNNNNAFPSFVFFVDSHSREKEGLLLFVYSLFCSRYEQRAIVCSFRGVIKKRILGLHFGIKDINDDDDVSNNNCVFPVVLLHSREKEELEDREDAGNNNNNSDDAIVRSVLLPRRRPSLRRTQS